MIPGDYNIYLDDERVAPNDYLQAFTAPETIELLEWADLCRRRAIEPNAKEWWTVNILSLDHDLGGDDDPAIGCGYDVLLWIEEKVATDETYVPPRTIKVHSANVSARTKMELAISAIEKMARNRG